MEIYQILHIPTGEYLTSVNRNGKPVLCADEECAKKIIYSVVMHTAYVGGAPISDYFVNSLEKQEFCLEEFDTISTTAPVFQYPKPRILSL